MIVPNGRKIVNKKQIGLSNMLKFQASFITYKWGIIYMMYEEIFSL
jgi:hypothetical protein